MPELECIEYQAGADPDAAVIWLHGLGADGHDFVPIVEQLHLPGSLSIRFIFPNAPIRPITINQGYRMPGWYDIASLNIVDREDTAGIIESSDAIARLCDKQVALGIASHRIIVAGFSQGGAIALHCGLHYARPLAGIIALSTYLPHCVSLDMAQSPADNRVPVFMAHGLEDDVVAHVYGNRSMQRLQQAGYPVEWHSYAMAHNVCMDEIGDIRRWLLSQLG